MTAPSAASGTHSITASGIDQLSYWCDQEQIGQDHGAEREQNGRGPAGPAVPAALTPDHCAAHPGRQHMRRDPLHRRDARRRNRSRERPRR